MATSVQPLVDEGRTSIEVLVKAINGETVETWYKDKIDMLDADNVDSYDPAFYSGRDGRPAEDGA